MDFKKRIPMEKRIHPIAKVFAVIFLILFVITGLAAILSFNSFNLAFSPSLYKDALSDAGVYEKLHKLIGEQIVYQVEHNPCIQNPDSCSKEQASGMPIYFKDINSAEWSTVIGKLIDPVWFQAQVESAIDQIVTFISNPGQPLSINLSLMELKARLGGEEGYQAMLLLIQSLEPCSFKVSLELPYKTTDIGELSSIELCNPNESALQLREDIFRTALQDVSETIPENTSTFFNASNNRMGDNLAASLGTLQMIRMAAMFSPIIPLFLLLIATLLVVRNLRGFLKWWGIPFTIIGVLLFVSSLFITPLIRSVLLVRFNFQGLVPSLVDMIKTVILNIAHSFENALIIQAGILFIAGIVMILVAIILKPKTITLPGE